MGRRTMVALFLLAESQRMKADRVIESSSGPALLAYKGVPTRGAGVLLTTFDAEGWEADTKLWTERGHHVRGETLSEFLKTALGVPTWEALQLAERVSGEWKAEWEAEWQSRDGSTADRHAVRFAWSIVLTIIVVCAFAAIGLALLSWWLVN